jgi:hypothetical protein
MLCCQPLLPPPAAAHAGYLSEASPALGSNIIHSCCLLLLQAKDAVVQAIITELKLSPAVAELVWQGAVGPNGFLANPNLTITDQQMLAVASIRQQFNGLLGYAPLYQDLSGILLGGPLQDYSVRDEALALIAQNPGQNYNARVAQYKA